MKKRLTKSLIAGILATGIMSIVLFVISMMGLPELSPPDMLAAMLGFSVSTGWSIHFIIGIIFALSYTFYFEPKVKIKNSYFKGIVFGLSVFVFAQIFLGIMSTFLTMPESNDSNLSIMVSSILGHIFFGLAVAAIVGNPDKLAGVGFRDHHEL
jgi:uncharacterized membrane protein YagU involved in acid resistance